MSKNKVYTSVYRHFNDLLVRGYENGEPFQVKERFSPSLYYESPTKTEFVDHENKHHLKKKTYSSMSDMSAAIKEMSNVHGHRIYGTRNVITQYLTENYPEDIEWYLSQLGLWFFDIETKVGEGVDWNKVEIGSVKTKIADGMVLAKIDGEDTEIDPEEISGDTLVYDHETGEFVAMDRSCYRSRGFPKPSNAFEEIQLITMLDFNSNKIFVWATKPLKKDNPIFKNTIDFRSFKTEKEMMADFIKFFRTTRIDIISGWNSVSFDIPYIINRCKRIFGENVPNLLSPWKIVDSVKMKFERDGEDDEEIETFNIAGICHLDYLEIYKKFNPGSKESFKLDFIAEYELGYGKVDNPYESFKEFYQKDFDLFTEYNVKDVTLLRDLEKKMCLAELACMIAYMSRVNIDDVVSSMRVWEAIIYKHFADAGKFVLLNKDKNAYRKIPGAYVHQPTIGKHGWTVSVDAESLYPSIMIQNNISPETKIGKLDVCPDSLLSGIFPDFDSNKYILSGNGVLTSKEQMGFIPFLVKQKFDQRKTFKKEMLTLETEAQQIRDELTRRGITF